MLSAMVAPGAGMPVQASRLDQLWVENRDLKRSLGVLRESYQQLELECSFNRTKAVELQDIAQIRGSNDDLHDKLVLKSLHAAELQSQVEKMKFQLKQANSCVIDLGKERESNKRMLLELADIVRTLQSVPIEYEATSHTTSYLRGQDASLRNVKKKVEAIIVDRKKLVAKCNKLYSENKRKDEKISALEAQFHLVNSANISKGSSDESVTTSTTFTESIESPFSRTFTQDSQESSSSDPLQSPRQTIRRDAPETPSLFKQNHAKRSEIHFVKHPWAKEAIPADDASCASTAQVTVTSRFSSVQVQKVGSYDDVDEVVGLRNELKEEQIRCDTLQNALDEANSKCENLQNELEKANIKYDRFKEVCKDAFEKMNDVEDDLLRTRQALASAVAKRDEYKEGLRDVINEYKELHGEHSDALEKVGSLESELNLMAEDNVAMETEMNHLEEQKMDLFQVRMEARRKVLSKEGIATLDSTEEALLEAYRCSEERIVTLERKLDAVKREAEEKGDKKETLDRKLRDAVTKYTKLEQERAIMELQVAKAEEDVRLSRKEAQRHREEARHTRRRLAGYVKKVKKLETGQDITLDAISTANPSNPVDVDGVLRRMLLVELKVASKAWNAKMKLSRENQKLDKENDELKNFCVEVLSEVGTVTKQLDKSIAINEVAQGQ